MKILAIDTALGACSVCVVSSTAHAPLAEDSLAMERGHAEALMPLLDRVMSQVSGGFGALHRVAVTIGPGSYTGLRVGISAARAIGLAADIPVVGVTTLSALLAPLVSRDKQRLIGAAIDARHGQVYFQANASGGRTVIPPCLIGTREVVRLLGNGPVTLSGSGAPLVAAEAWAIGIDAEVADAPLAPDVQWVARLGLVADPTQALPKPVYLKKADAKPQEQGRLARRS